MAYNIEMLLLLYPNRIHILRYKSMIFNFAFLNFVLMIVLDFIIAVSEFIEDQHVQKKEIC